MEDEPGLAVPLDRLTPAERERAERRLADRGGASPPALSLTVQGLKPGEASLDIRGDTPSERRAVIRVAIDELQRALERLDEGSGVETPPSELRRLAQRFQVGDIEAVSQLEQELATDEERLSPEGREMLDLARQLIARRGGSGS